MNRLDSNPIMHKNQIEKLKLSQARENGSINYLETEQNVLKLISLVFLDSSSFLNYSASLRLFATKINPNNPNPIMIINGRLSINKPVGVTSGNVFVTILLFSFSPINTSATV